MLSKLIDSERLIHSTKTAIACLIGYLVTKLFDFPVDQCIIISIIVVMCTQIYVGSVFQKGYLRFLGTFAGCLIASFTLLYVGISNVTIAVTISVSAFLFSFVTTGRENISYIGPLGATTTAIVLLSKDPSLTVAAERFIEIGTGIFIATLVSQFVLPIHATTHLHRAQINTLIELRRFYQVAMIDQQPIEKTIDLDESIVKALLKQRQLAKESAHELLGFKFNPQYFMQQLYCEREILRSINFMQKALTFLQRTGFFLHVETDYKNFNQATLKMFDELIQTMETGSPPKDTIYPPVTEDFVAAIKQHQENLSADNLRYIQGLLFSAEMFVLSLAKLADLHHIPRQNT